MTKYVGFGRLKEAQRNADAKEEATTEPSTPVESAAPVPSTPEPRHGTAPARSTAAPTTPVQSTPLPDLPRDALKAEYTKMPNGLLDGACASLTPAAQLVYLVLVRLTVGHNRPTCRIGIPNLCKRLGLSEKGVQKALAQLVQAGLITRGDTDGSNPKRQERGTEYRVFLPAGTPGLNTAVPSTPAVRAGVERAPVQSGGAQSAAMKETPKESYESEVFELRTVAARFHHAYPDESHEARVERVVSSLVGQGRPVTREAVEEALRGLAL